MVLGQVQSGLQEFLGWALVVRDEPQHEEAALERSMTSPTTTNPVFLSSQVRTMLPFLQDPILITVSWKFLGKGCDSALLHTQPSHLCLQARCLERTIHLFCWFHGVLTTDNSYLFFFKTCKLSSGKLWFYKSQGHGSTWTPNTKPQGRGQPGASVLGPCRPLAGVWECSSVSAFWNLVASPIPLSSEQDPPEVLLAWEFSKVPSCCPSPGSQPRPSAPTHFCPVYGPPGRDHWHCCKSVQAVKTKIQ